MASTEAESAPRYETLVATSSLPVRRGFALAGMLGGLAALVSSGRAKREPWETDDLAGRILESPAWPESFPLTAEHLSRIDPAPDTIFYAAPRVNVQHIDEHAGNTCRQRARQWRRAPHATG